MIDGNVLGRRVRELRKARGWTQDDLHANSGLSQGEISKIEKGQINVTAETLMKLAGAFEIHTEDLVKGTHFANLFGQSQIPRGDIETGPPIIAYFASALTGLVDRDKKEIEDLDERVDQICRSYSTYPLVLYRPRKTTSPTENPDVPARAVYDIDQQRVASAHIVILAAIFPSLGAGMELQLALQSGTTVILINKRGQKVSRMVLGWPGAIERVEYSDLDDLEGQVVTLLDHLLPSIARSQFLQFNPESDGAGFELGERVRRLRIERHLQPSDLANMVGVGAAYIENLESKSESITNPSLALLRRIARALFTTESYLIAGLVGLDKKFQGHYDCLESYAAEVDMSVKDFNVLWGDHYQEYQYDLSIPGVANRAIIGDRNYWADRYERLLRAKTNGDLFSTAAK